MRPPSPGCARTRSVRPATASTAPGWPTPGWCRWRWRSSIACWASDRIKRSASATTCVADAARLVDLTVPNGQVTEAGLRNNVSVALQYLNAWLQGTGAAAINNLMEDAATAEISRAQLWHWIRKGASTEDGEPITRRRYERIRAEELAKLGGADNGSLRGRRRDPRQPGARRTSSLPS